MLHSTACVAVDGATRAVKVSESHFFNSNAVLFSVTLVGASETVTLHDADFKLSAAECTVICVIPFLCAVITLFSSTVAISAFELFHVTALGAP